METGEAHHARKASQRLFEEICRALHLQEGPGLSGILDDRRVVRKFL